MPLPDCPYRCNRAKPLSDESWPGVVHACHACDCIDPWWVPCEMNLTFELCPEGWV